ncbi:MAG: hypothetical protein ACRDKX_07635, partial [Solirubrobacterales bacterium]
PESVAVSPDGTSVYLTSRFDSAIAQFSRDPATGALDYIGCDSGEDDIVPAPCDAIGPTTADGVNSGFHDPKIKAVVFSADGRFVYAAGEQDHSIVVFERDTTSGELDFDSCLTGEEESSPPCDEIDTATSGGDESGLNQPRWLVIGPDDVSLYSVNNNDHSIARFSRDPGSGDLDFEDCITGDTDVGGACEEIPSADTNATDSGFQSPRAMAISPDGEFAYAVSGSDSAVLSFDRDAVTGELDYLGCLTGEEVSGPEPDGSGACALLPTATEFGDDSGFAQMRSMAISADGVSVYTSAQVDDAVATFDRNPVTGALTFDGCLTGAVDVDGCAKIASATEFGEESGLDDLETMALSADGRSLYGAAEFDDAVSRFDREPVPAPEEPETANCQRDKVPKTDGTDGDDDLTGTSGKDAIFGLAGRDRIKGIGGPDCLEGDSGRDVVKGGGGRDRVKGDGGADKLRGQGGRDRLNGGGGKDRLNGAKKADSLRGGGGKDKLQGGPGRDKLRGNGGKDKIVTGGGKDKVNCGDGRDRVTAGANDKVADNCERVI